MAYTYAGERSDVMDKAVHTLESLQNDDGGWRIGRSLVGGTSDRSVVESTSECLLALASVGRTETQTYHNGVRWLEDAAHRIGGWASVAGHREPSVFPTTMAIRALAELRQGKAVNSGVAWLRSVQQTDGGWGSSTRENSGSEPAYTAYAIVALLKAGAPASDEAVQGGCDYLCSTFDETSAEPWHGATASNIIQVDPPARLDYRHFATPWAVVALCLANHDLSDPVVLVGLNALLKLRNDDGSWRCDKAPAGLAPVWATHDAVLALCTTVETTRSNMGPVALSHYESTERAMAAQVIGTMLGQSCESPADRESTKPLRRKPRLLSIWLSALSVAVILVALGEFGVVRQLESSSGLHRIAAAVGSVSLTVTGAVVPALVVDEYRNLRRRKSAG